jgi:hypothetical protein
MRLHATSCKINAADACLFLLVLEFTPLYRQATSYKRQATSGKREATSRE